MKEKKELNELVDWVERAQAEGEVRKKINELFKVLNLAGLKTLLAFLDRFTPKKNEKKGDGTQSKKVNNN